MSARSPINRTISVVVPIVVAVIGLIGVLVTAFINTRKDDKGSINETPRASIRIVNMGTREIYPPPSVELYFTGTADGITSIDEIFVISSFESDGGETHALSPRAISETRGSWRVSWKLPRMPASTSFEAVVVRHATKECPPDKRCFERVTLPIDLDKLIRDGSRADGVVARADGPSS